MGKGLQSAFQHLLRHLYLHSAQFGLQKGLQYQVRVSLQFSWHDFARYNSMAKLTFPHCNRYAECRCGCAVQQLLLLAYVVSLARWSNTHNGKPSTGLFLLAASVAPSPTYSPVTVAIGTCLAWAGHWTGAILRMHGCSKCRGKRNGALDLGTVRIRQHRFHIYP